MTRRHAAACAVAIVAVLGLSVWAQEPGRAVAITIDDLPSGGDRGGRTFEAVWSLNERLLRPFKAGRIPVTGFVNQGRAENLGFGLDGTRRLLDLWLDAGAGLGNHSHSHLNINNVPLADYTADIVKGEPVLRAALAARGATLRHFRHRFCSPARRPRSSQPGVPRYGYRVAPVTIDDADYMYRATARSFASVSGAIRALHGVGGRSSKNGRWRS
jgi:peptidoglycan/xylan/chitin deacetylase (PgdA/CDA1 family)